MVCPEGGTLQGERGEKDRWWDEWKNAWEDEIDMEEERKCLGSEARTERALWSALTLKKVRICADTVKGAG